MDNTEAQRRKATGLKNFLSNRGLKPEIKYFVGEVVVDIFEPLTEELVKAIASFMNKVAVEEVTYRRRGEKWRQWSFQYKQYKK